MKKLLNLLVIASVGFGADIAGDYLSISKDGKRYRFLTTFTKDGKIKLMGTDIGNWKKGEDEKTILISSIFDNGKTRKDKIVLLNQKSLKLQDNKGVFSYRRIDREKLLQNNKNAPILGSWIFKSQDKIEYFIFKLPDNFRYILEEPNKSSTSKSEGNWYYDKSKKELLIASMNAFLSGKSKIISVDKEKIVLIHQGKINTLKRKK
ncbi:hypothetical protein MNB_SM-7-1126 [hydrothermal vent metagenome]|uniref:Uncharacterized protein n=1 Tax=hydrothermal vent metagenome TaxID=652676 RepID=A0A1W1BAR3_9ZZZZ